MRLDGGSEAEPAGDHGQHDEATVGVDGQDAIGRREFHNLTMA